MLYRTVAVLPVLFVLSGCSEAPKPAAQKEPAKPAEPVTALSAVYKMYTQARSWAPDCKLLRVASMDTTDVKGKAGKSGAWEATFVSEGQGRARRYTFSVVEEGGSLHEGVFAGSADSWSAGSQAKPFNIQAFKADSTQAFEAAMTKSADYAAKHPEMPVKFLLEQTNRFPDAAWRVIWGESVSASNYSVFVDASTGNYLQTVR